MRSLRKQMVAVMFVALTVPARQAHAAETRAADCVVAVVNRDVITRRDVLDRAQAALRAIETGLSDQERAKRTTEILATALRGLVDEKLLAAEGERLLKYHEALSARVDDHLKAHFENERRKAGGEAAFRTAIRQRGLAYNDYLKRARAQVIREAVLYQFVMKGLSVGPAEALDYYRNNVARYQEPATVTCRQIFVRADDYETRAKAAGTAEYLVGLLKKQHSFERLAREYSDGPYAAKGGLWPPKPRGARPEPVDDLLFSLHVGEIGGPVETSIGFTILKVEESARGRTIPFEEVQNDIEQELLRTKRVRRYQRLIERIQKEQYVEILQ